MFRSRSLVHALLVVSAWWLSCGHPQETTKHDRIRQKVATVRQRLEVAVGSHSLRKPDGVALAKRNETLSAEPTPKPGRHRKVINDAADDAREAGSRLAHPEKWEKFQNSTSRNSNALASTFLPGFQFSWRTLIMSSTTVMVAMIWITLYFMFIYECDRSETLERWTGQGGMPLDADGGSLPRNVPDVVLVFHHPLFGYKDGDTTVSSKAFQRLLVSQEPGTFPKLQALRQQGNVSRVKAREALLQDVYTNIADMGFDVSIFSSIDNDELFVGITLRQLDVIEHYLTTNNMELQIRKEIIGKLGIEHPAKPMGANSPPFLKYDVNHVEALFNCGILGANDSHELFQTYGSDLHKHRESSIISSLQCIRIILSELTRQCDLDACVYDQLLTTWYPVHNPWRLKALRVTWASYTHICSLSFVQPLTYIEGYFGSRVAFAFEWQGCYCKSLLAILPVAILCSPVSGLVSALTAYDDGQFLAFCFILTAWSRLAHNVWRREQSYFSASWERPAGSNPMVRPQFQGELQPSLVDLRRLEKQYPARLATTRLLCSNLVTAIFCIIVSIVISGCLYLFEGHMNIMASICLSALIKIFQLTWNYMSVVLTDWENHKYQTEYVNSYLWKQFIFQAVNNYAAFFFLTFRPLQKEEGCNEGECLEVLRSQLFITLLILSACRIAEVLALGLLVKLSLWHELHQHQKTLRAEPPKPSETEDAGADEKAQGTSSQTAAEARSTGDLVARSQTSSHNFIEEQAKFGDFRLDEQVQVMLQLVIGLGFVLIFGAVAPLVVPLCFMVFVVNLRGSAIQICNYSRRTVPRKSDGIEAWEDVLAYMMKFGVLFSGFLYVAHGSAFRKTPLITKVTGFVVFAMVAGLLWSAVDAACPQSDSATLLLKARRKYVVHALHKVTQGSASHLSKVQLRKIAMNFDDVDRGMWATIKHFDGSPQ